ncbi:uroporphyrinogen-III synthase, partial [Psychrobacter immobilis]
DDDNNNERKDIAINALQAPSYLIAVGEATASVLNNAKIEATNYQVLQPHIANNEGMLAMPEIERLQAGDKLLVWRGLGGRRLLVDTLLARGVHIDSIAWYERIMPVEAMAQYEQWLQGVLARNGMQDTSASQPKPIVVVSSGTAFEHWESIVRAVTEKALEQETARETPAILPYKLSDFSYVVLGERLANMVAEQQLSYWRVEDLAPETILAAIHAKAC